MTLIEFLSLGLKHGQRVSLTVKDHFDGEKTVTCHFSGFRIYAGRTKATKPDDIVPVFNITSGNGRMLNRHISENTWLDHIVSITPEDPSQTIPLTCEDVSGFVHTEYNIKACCKQTLSALLKEMSILFPGKKIYLDTDKERIGAVHYFRHGEAAGDITAVKHDNGTIRYDLSMEYDNEKELPEDDIEVFSVPSLLRRVLDSIREPFFPEYEEDPFLDPGTLSWNDVPETDASTFTVLHRTKVLSELMANLWYASLSDGEKLAIFSGLRSRYEMMKAEKPETELSFPAFIDREWNVLNPDWKALTLKERMRKDES